MTRDVAEALGAEKSLPRHWMERFVRESNRIDPQGHGHVNEPGDPHFDDHLASLWKVIDLARNGIAAPPRQIHWTLMHRLRGISGSDVGAWRQHEVVVGGRRGTKSSLVNKSMTEWDEKVASGVRPRTGLDEDRQKLAARLAAWDLHIAYERIHPFADGNGRSGRLLMVNHAIILGLDPWIVPYDHRHAYFQIFDLEGLRRDMAVNHLIGLCEWEADNG